MPHLWCKGAALSVPGGCTFSGTIRSCGFSGVYLWRQYSYGILSVYQCWTLGTRQLDFWYQTAGLFWYYYSKVFTVAFLSVVGRCFLILHSNWLAAWRSVSLRLQSLNQKTLTDYHGFITESLHGSVFWFFLFDLYFDFRLIWIVPWQDKRDFRRIRLLILSAY